jgi:hypothetical protein
MMGDGRDIVITELSTSPQRRVRRENEILRWERDILEKVTVFSPGRKSMRLTPIRRTVCARQEADQAIRRHIDGFLQIPGEI